MSTSNWRRVNKGVLHVIWIMLVINLIYSGNYVHLTLNMWGYQEAQSLTFPFQKTWSQECLAHPRLDMQSWFHFLVRNKEEVLREFLVMATVFSEHLDSTHWYARSSPELKKDNCPMWIESYIVSRYTCCLKQNNYIILLIMSKTLLRLVCGGQV